jgi:hypothetical protein
MARPRARGTNVNGGSFSEATVESVWKKAAVISGRDSNTYRNDACGKMIKRSDHGNTSSEYGWEVDHIKPVARDGTDDLYNLQPLYWKTNRDKGDTYPWSCPR